MLFPVQDVPSVSLLRDVLAKDPGVIVLNTQVDAVVAKARSMLTFMWKMFEQLTPDILLMIINFLLPNYEYSRPSTSSHLNESNN